MVFFLLENHSFRVFVGHPDCPSLTNYGQILHKKKLELQLEVGCMVLNMKKVKAFTAHAKKGKGKGRKFQGKKDKGGRSSLIPEQKKKDLSHIKCFKCQKYSHYARQCHESKKRKHQASTIDIDEDT